jgi:transposase
VKDGSKKQAAQRAEFKAQVVMAALAGDKTFAEPASEYWVHPTMIRA